MPKPLTFRDPVILVKVVGAGDGGWTPTKGSTVRCLLCGLTGDLENLSHQTTVSASPTIVDGKPDRLITVANFRQNTPVVGQYYLAHRFGNGYVIDNQATFLEYQ
jgi:hypothetical protein